MGKILSYGELLLRVCPDADGNWLEENSLPFYVGGAELNVATALALWALPSAYFTALPDNFMSKQLVEYVEGLGIDASPVQFEGDRVGLYYLHKGKDLKNSGVIYDRAHSSFSEIKTGTINWDEVLSDVSWFHFSAICPALSQASADLCEEVLKEASARNIKISIDLNYRAKLWQYGKQPNEVLPTLVQYCDVVMGNVWAAEKMLGLPVSATLVEEDQKKAYLEQARITSEALVKQYPKCMAVANTFRFDQDKGIKYYTTLYTGQLLHVSHEYGTDSIVDKVGSGDCFMAGLIYGFYNKHQPASILEFATAAAFSKLFIASDATTLGVEEIKERVKNYVVL